MEENITQNTKQNIRQNRELNIIDAKDLAAPELAIYAERSEIQLLHYCEPEPGIFIAESLLVIERALDAGYMPLSLLVEPKQLAGNAAALAERCNSLCPGIPVYTAPSEVLDQITGYHLARGVLCAMRRMPAPLIDAGSLGNYHRVAVLENVMNPTNLGAIFRSAAALGMEAVLLTEGCTDPLYRRAARVSMGTVFQIPWAWLPAGWTGLMKNEGFLLAAMALRDDTVSISDPALHEAERLAVVLGSEGPGLLPETIAACDWTIKIPMSHGVDSLNVAAASAVAFWELGRRSL